MHIYVCVRVLVFVCVCACVRVYTYSVSLFMKVCAWNGASSCPPPLRGSAVAAVCWVDVRGGHLQALCCNCTRRIVCGANTHNQ